MIGRVIVCGAGTMGSGIAEATARAGFTTLLYDVDTARAVTAVQQVHKNLDVQVAKGKLSPEQRTTTLSHLAAAEGLEACTGSLVIEAIVESLPAKQSLFQQLAAINDTDTILASNTSSLSVSAIAEGLPHPERVCGLHFFNPAQLMKLVEVVAAAHTASPVIGEMVAFCRALGKVPVVCKDSPGFIVNRVARHYYLEPLRLVEAGYSDFAQLDRLLESSGFRMGPFRLMDLIGNDINFAVTTSLYEASGKALRFTPSAIQAGKVAQGALGRKTGHGYYTYSPESSRN